MPRAAMILFGSALLLGLLAGGCAPHGSSFETLGVPAARPTEGRAALIVGWALEERQAWRIMRVRVNGRRRTEWDAATQRPTVVHLRPGSYRLQLLSEQTSQRIGGRRRPQRRHRSKALDLELEAGERQLCVVWLSKGTRRRPRVLCESRDDDSPVDEEIAQAPPEPEAEPATEPEPATAEENPADLPRSVGPVTRPPGTAAGPARSELTQSPYTPGLDQRVDSIEERLERMEGMLRRLVEASGAPAEPEADEEEEEDLVD